VNVGGLLREAQQEYRHKLENKIDIAGTHLAEAGPVLEAMMSTGNILPSWVTVTILRGHLEKIAAEVESGKHTKESRRPPAILIDGFPRSDENFIQFETLIGATRRLIVVDVDDEAMIHRIQQRGLTSGRADDQSLDTIRNRLRVFSQETGEVINKFTPYHTTEPVAAPVEVTADGRYVVKVDGNATPDDVTVGFQAAFLRLLDL
jgi:adenylate kinase family enzyme